MEKGILYDDQWEEVKIIKVRDLENGWEIKREDGWEFSISKPSPIVPEIGMTARFYGKGIGYPFRGVALDGTIVFYRTEAEDEIYQKELLYGKDICEWLDRWDSGRGVWSLEMGGIGPGYEQAIQITVAEVVRELICGDYDAVSWEDKEKGEADGKKIEDAIFAIQKIKDLGLSGAQWGGAMSLACLLFRRGPTAVFTDEKLKDRTIQVGKNFPGGGRKENNDNK